MRISKIRLKAIIIVVLHGGGTPTKQSQINTLAMNFLRWTKDPTCLCTTALEMSNSNLSALKIDSMAPFDRYLNDRQYEVCTNGSSLREIIVQDALYEKDCGACAFAKGGT